MAELAIPLIALGSMYVMSNQDKQKKNLRTEGSATMSNTTK